MCLGCKLANKENVDVYRIYDNDFFSVILNKAPFNEGHLLVMPKRHVEDFCDLKDEELASLSITLKQMSNLVKTVFEPDGITICQHGGIYNDLGHISFHVIPRYENDGVDFGKPTNNYCASLILNKTQKKLLNRIEEVV
ncbi:HIT family protein [Clostridium ihumii]|uniref:HIT family protein n=1 Tax=Clostridium ihumii TaxID=1470356 RepID=UPI0006881173|nr:HIT family protein [Clostridium ihumii]